MANRFICGFDDYDITGAAYEWAVLGTAGYVTLATKLTGSCVKIRGSVGSTSQGYIVKNVFVTPVATAFIGFRLELENLNGSDFFAVGDSTQSHLAFTVNTDGTISAYRQMSVASSSDPFYRSSRTLLGTSSSVVATDTPIYLEFEITISNTVGVIRIYANGSITSCLELTDQDTQNLGTAYISWIAFSGGTSSTYYQYMDDIYVNDTTGTKNTGLEGDVQVHSHFPKTPAGNSSQWDRSTGSDQWATIDDNPQDTADYNSTSTLNEVDTLNIDDFANAGANILAVQVNILAVKVQSGTAGIASVHRINSTDYVHATTNYLGTGHQYLRWNYDQQGDSTDWNETDFNAQEFGYKKTA